MSYNNYPKEEIYRQETRVVGQEPETLTNPVFTPGYLREQIGKLVRVEFLIGTTNIQDRIGVLEEVGASFIVLRGIQDNNKLYCDIYSIKFVTIIENPTPFDTSFGM